MDDEIPMGKEQFIITAKNHRKKLFFWLFISITIFLFFGWAGFGVEHSHGWAGQLVSFIFKIIGTIGFFGAIITSFKIFNWFKYYKEALIWSQEFSAEHFWHIFNAVVGPTPWKNPVKAENIRSGMHENYPNKNI